MRQIKKCILFMIPCLLLACGDPSSVPSVNTSSSINSSLSTTKPPSISSSIEKGPSISLIDSGSSSSSSPTSIVDETKVTAVQFIVKTVSVKVNEKAFLQWRIRPQTAVNKNVTFTVEDSSICSVSEIGEVEGLKEGTTKVHIISEEGHFEDVATINVTGIEAESIKLNVPENTLKSSTGTYYIKLGTSIQLSATVLPEEVKTKLTYTTTSSNESAEKYLSVDQNGLLTALKLKSNIVVSVATENFLVDTVKFSVLSEERYTQEFLKQGLVASIEKEKEQVISGMRKETRKTAVYDEETIENYHIYTNGKESEISFIDHTVNDKTKVSKTFEGIENNFYYSIEREGEDKYISTSKTEIGEGEDQITLEKASSNVNLARYRTTYGLGNIINDYIIQSIQYFGTSESWISYGLSEEDVGENHVYTLRGTFEVISNYWATLSIYKELELVMRKNSEGVFIGFDFKCDEYDESFYDFKTHTLKENAKTRSQYTLSYSQTLGTKTANDAFEVTPESCYFDSFTINTYKFKDEGYTTNFEVEDIIYFDIITQSPATATTIIDPIRFVSSSNKLVADYSSFGGLKALSEGTTTLTFATVGGVQASIDISVRSKTPTGIVFSEIAKKGITIGETLENITAKVEPTGAKNDYSISILEGEEYASLSYQTDTKSYSLTGKAVGKVVLKATNLENPELFATQTIYVYQNITADETLATIKAHPYKAISKNGKPYVLKFLENGMGKVTDDNEEIETIYGSFSYQVDGYNIIVTNSESIVSYFVSIDGTLTMAENGLEITGNLKRGTGFYDSETLTFTRCD